MASRSSIEFIDAPLACIADGVDLLAPFATNSVANYRVATRALCGMQKEALVAASDSAKIWRMACDEGPYLNGTDLAPPPLAYFSAGMATVYADALRLAAFECGTELRDLLVTLDNRYSMEGSAVRGTMMAAALPVELSVSAQVTHGDAKLHELVFDAVSMSPIDALMRDQLVDTFTISHNGQTVPTAAAAPSRDPAPPDPIELFRRATYPEYSHHHAAAVCKLESTASVSDAAHGKGASMKDVQKRELHIRTVLSVGEDGMSRARVQILRPIGSVFRFVADAPITIGGRERAPSGLAYVSASIAFCFMTQLGRYASIVKKDLADYRTVQDASFDLDNHRTQHIDTHAYLQTAEDDATAQRYVDMAEQTCFLHSACRMSNKTHIKIISPA